MFSHESPTLPPGLTIKYITVKNVILCTALYFVSITFTTLELGGSSTPAPQRIYGLS